MSDILERLRNPLGQGVMHQEAADEIERLRAERAADQQRLFHYERLIADFVTAVEKAAAKVFNQGHPGHE
jgi:hypothetical protein